MAEEGAKRVEIQQFAKKVHHYSSQYGSETSISYTVTNLAGMCTKYPHYGDFTQACVFRTYGPWWDLAPACPKPFTGVPESFNSVDYVELYFSEGCIPKEIEIFETYNPGAVVRVLAYVQLTDPVTTTSGPYKTAWVTLWNGDPVDAPRESRIFSPPLKDISYPTNLIRLELNHSLCDYYTELDAVRLTGLQPLPEEKHPLPDLAIDAHTGYPPDYEYALREYGTPVDPFPFPGTSGYDDSSEENNTLVHTRPVEANEGADESADSAKRSGLGETGTSKSREDSNTTKTCSEALAQDLSRLHITDGLTAALEQSNNGYFDLLPGEAIQNILSYLDVVSLCRLAQTSRLFHQHCYDPLLFLDLSLKPFWSKVSDEVLNDLHSRCRYIQRFSLSWCGGFRTITSSSIARFLNACGSNLTTVHMGCCRFLNDSNMPIVAKALCDFCPVLEELDLQSNKNIFSGGSFQELSCLKSLRRLNLYRTYIDTLTINVIIKGCPLLESLNLGSCGSINDFDTVLTLLSVHCKQLKHLDAWRARSLTEVGLRALSKGCPDLEELDIGWCPNLRSGTGIFFELAQHCPKLRKLYLTANRTVCDSDLNALAHYSKELEQLDILGTREISPNFTRKVLEQCPRLKMIDLSFCAAITPEFVDVMGNMFPNVNIKRSFQT